MPYINYNENGNITAQFACQQYEGQLYTDLDDLTTYKVISGEVVINPDYEDEMRLIEIDNELSQIDYNYEVFMDSSITYTNGYTYKPKYVNDYVLMIASGLEYEIWDASELHSEVLDTQGLSMLAMFLKSQSEGVYQARKINRKALIEERNELKGI